MTVKLLTEEHLEFLSLKGGCTGYSESTPVKMPHCWKSHVAAHNPQLIKGYNTSNSPPKYWSINPLVDDAEAEPFCHK